jgi:hypothetical protein
MLCQGDRTSSTILPSNSTKRTEGRRDRGPRLFCAVVLAVMGVAVVEAGTADAQSAAPVRAHAAGRSSCVREPHVNLSSGSRHRSSRAGHARRVCSPGGNKAIHHAAPQLGGGYPNARIAEVALARVGQKGGQCKEAVNIWVALASNGTQHLGGDYLQNYRNEGGHEVSRDEAVEGDIIQLNGPNGNYYYEGMHTAVVVSHTVGSETFEVVDSNYEWNEIIREHAWNPYTIAKRYGLTVHIWRMGSAGSPGSSGSSGSSTGTSNNGSPLQGSSPTLQGSSGNAIQPAAPESNLGGGGASPFEYHGPTYVVMNTSETLPDGVWFRNSPHEEDTSRITGLGPYKNESVELHCYAFGDAVGPYNDRLWYYATDVTRPTIDGKSNVGYLNAHFINDGKVANEIDAGVPEC